MREGTHCHSLKIGPTGSFFRDGFFQNSFQPRSTVTQTIGHHTLYYGASYGYTQLNILNRRQNTGIIAFSNFASFAEGAVKSGGSSTFLQGVTNRYYRTNDVGDITDSRVPHAQCNVASNSWQCKGKQW